MTIITGTWTSQSGASQAPNADIECYLNKIDGFFKADLVDY
jgi:hypothetical protein